MSQSILVNTIIALVGRCITLALGLIATAFMTRVVSVADFGTYSLIFAVGTFFQLIADFGLYLTASHELGRGDASKVEFGHIISLRIALLVVVYGLGGIAYAIIPSLHSTAMVFYVIACGLVAQSVSQLIMSIFQAFGIVWRATVSDILGRIVQVGVLGALLYNASGGKTGPVGLAYALSGGLLVSVCIQLLLVPRKAMLFPKIRFNAWKYLVVTSFPIAALLVLNIIYFKIDTVMLAFLRSSQEVGWYSLSYKIIEHTLFIPAMIGGLVLPHMGAALRKKRYGTVNRLIEESLLVVLALVVPIVGVCIVYSNQIILFISTDSFSASGPILKVLAWAAGIMFIGNILGFTLIALQKQRQVMMLYAALVVGNILANYVYIPLYGALGAAWVTVVTEGIATTVASFLVYREIQWVFPLSYTGKLICSITIAIAISAALPIHIHIVMKVACVAVVYGIIGYTMGIWNKETISILRLAKHV